jgi:hypothetical protein
MDCKRIPKREYEVKVEGRRRVGRPRGKWWVLLKKDFEERLLDWKGPM